MPRNRHQEVEVTKPVIVDEEDYLDVDKPIPGQNYYCISFVSPEKVLEQKELFMFHHYEKSVHLRMKTELDNALTDLINKSENGNVDIADIVRIKKALNELYKDRDYSLAEFKSKYEDFKFRDEEKVGEAFDKQNNFKTSVRGVKVRGTYDTRQEAETRAKVLQRNDRNFDVFVGQVGYWCPWDPCAQKIDDVEYLDKDLNNLMKEYKANEAKKDQFYQEQKAQRQKDALSAEDRLKHQEGLQKMNEYRDSIKNQQEQKALEQSTISNTPATSSITFDSLFGGSGATSEETSNTTQSQEKPNTKSMMTGGENAPEITLEQQAEQLTNADPWLQRKMEQMSVSEK